MARHNKDRDHEKNKIALGLVKRGDLNGAAQVLSTTSNANKTNIKNRILKGQNARKTQSG